MSARTAALALWLLAAPLGAREAAAPPEALERAALAVARRWTEGGGAPGLGGEGAVVFPYGARLPVVVCAPLYPCHLVLEAGEAVRRVQLGDAVRWRVEPVRFASGPAETVALAIKPTDAGLHTAMSVATDRRLYTVRLVSRERDWMPRVAFSYPERVEAAWDRYYEGLRAERAAAALDGGLHVDRLDFGYAVRPEGRVPWAPVRVYTDGARTWIQFPGPAADSAPALAVAEAEGEEPAMVNYRLRGDRYEVDGVVRRAVLWTGAGGAGERVDIVRED